jgi:TetR/AcrR family transcriptional regulator, cholesterol catabolism regulator
MSTMPKAAESSRSRRRELFAVAARLFWERGYAGTTLQDIANAMQVRKASVYHYIDSKEDLLDQVLGESFQDIRENMARVAQRDDDALELLRELMHEHVASIASNPIPTAVFYRDFQALSEPRRGAILESRRDYERLLRGLIERGQSAGTISKDVSSTLATRAVLGLLNSIFLWYRPEGELTPEQLADQYADMAIGLLVGTR